MCFCGSSVEVGFTGAAAGKKHKQKAATLCRFIHSRYQGCETKDETSRLVHMRADASFQTKEAYLSQRTMSNASEMGARVNNIAAAQ